MPRRPPRRVQPVFYLVPSFILLATLILSILPLFFEAATFIYDADFLRIIYILLSLSIALYLFGFLGDSSASVQNNRVGLNFQVGGSAAGALIFFYFFSSGLNPYRDLTVYLRDAAKPNQPLLSLADGNVSLTIATDIERKATAQEGVVYFRDLPRSEDWHLIPGGDWRVNAASPDRCWNHKPDDIVINRKCSKVELLLAKTKQCLRDQSAILNDPAPTPTNLDVVLGPFKAMLEAKGVSLKIAYPSTLDKSVISKNTFTVFRQHSTSLNACGLLAEIEDSYNTAYPKQPIKVYASCQSILISGSHDAAPSEEYKSCEQ
jgi:hypothetical protein